MAVVVTLFADKMKGAAMAVVVTSFADKMKGYFPCGF